MALIFDLFTLGASDNRITFNDYANSPLYRAQRRYPTKRELREFDAVLPETIGVADFTTLIGKEFFIIEGKMYPNNETEFHSGRQALRKMAALALEQADSLTDSGYGPLSFVANVPQQIQVKVLYVDMEESTKLGQIQPFRIVCKIKYPVINATQAASGTITIGTSIAGTGGAQIPARIPLNIGSSNQNVGTSLPFVLPVVLGNTPGTGSLSLNNIGDFYTYPNIVFTGPVNVPRLTNVTTGQFIELNINLASSSNSAIVSYDQDTLTITASGTNVYGNLTSGSTLFKIVPGVNVFTFTGATVGTGANATVNFLPAWPLS